VSLYALTTQHPDGQQVRAARMVDGVWVLAKTGEAADGVVLAAEPLAVVSGVGDAQIPLEAVGL
jgi:hypothetical protein